MTPEEELAALEELDRLEDEEAKSAPPSPDAVKAAELSPVIAPSVSIPAQVLSTQPATTHPGGDEAAQADWVVKGADSTKDATIVYEPPVAIARKELMENPQLLKALFPDEEIPPEFIQNMDASSDIYKAYADHKWNDARWAAADSGRTAYRQAKMPWLQGQAAGLSPLQTLGAKLGASAGPAIDAANAFVLGVDDTAALGAGRKVAEAVDRATGNPTEDINEQRIEGYPGLHTAGQVVGMFSPGGVMGLLGKGTSAAIKGAGGLAAKLGGGAVTQGVAKLAGAGAAAVGGGAAVQTGREGVEAASNLEKTGETGTTLGESAGRVQAAALDPMNLGLGVGGEAASMVAGGIAKGIAGASRYGGNVERVEQLGGKMKFGVGPVGTKGTAKAIAAGKARDISPVDVMAEELAPKIAEAENAVASGNFQAAAKAKEDAKIAHGKFKQGYFATKEGQTALAPIETIQTNLKHLRDKVVPEPGGGLRPVGNAEGMSLARAELSGDVATVSTKPQPGAIELSPEEAELFLAPSLTKGLVPKTKGPTAPSGGPSGSPSGAGPTPIQSAGPLTEPPIPAGPGRGAMRKADTQVVPPGPEKTRGQEEALSMEPLRNARGAMQRDAKRAAALDKEFPPEVRDAIDRGVLPDEAQQKANWDKYGGSPDNIARLKAERGALYPEEVRGQQPEPAPEEQWRKNARAQAEGRRVSQLSPDKVKALRSESDKVASSLTEEETDAIRSFTSRHGDKVGSPAWESATQKLAVQNPTDAGPLYRGTRMPKEEIQKLIKSGTYKTSEPTSLSYNKDLADAFGHGREARGDKVMFEVQALKEGQNFLSPKLGVGKSGLEREINLAKPTTFKVVDSRVEDGITHIVLRDVALGAAAVGASAAMDEDGTGAALASAGGLALALKKRGITKVYAVPRRYDAQQHEVRIGQLQDLTKDPKAPGAREAKERYAAALRDRQQRPLNGQPGGWSAVQQQTSEKLKALDETLSLAEAEAKRKGSAKREAPGGSAAKRLVRYAQQRPGELPLKKEIESAGAAAGVTPQLNDLRLLEPLAALKGQMAYRRKSAPGTSKVGLIGAVADQAAMRLLYPGLKGVSGSQTLSGGLLGTRALQLKKKDEEAQK